MGAQPWGRLCLQRMKGDEIDTTPKRGFQSGLQSRQAEKRGAVRWFDEQVEIALNLLLITRIGAKYARAQDAMVAENVDQKRALALGEAAYTRIWNGRPPQVVSAPNIETWSGVSCLARR